MDSPATEPLPVPPDDTATACALLGPNVRRIREARGLTQTQLGVASGYQEKSAKVSISRIEARKALPRLMIMCRIAEALGVKPHQLLDPGYRPRACTKHAAGKASPSK